MAKRKTITKKVRFEVFKRDNFTCQYCGSAAPDVVLHLDHIEPVAKGGDNEVLNLITSCVNCNAGKSDRRLDDQSIVAKQRQQLAELSERREQIEMMLAWRNGLKSIKDSEADAAAGHWKELLGGHFSLTPTGIQEAKKLIRKFGFSAVVDAMGVVTETYVRLDGDGKPDAESVSAAFKKIGGVCALSSMPEDSRRLYYIRAILRNRLAYCDESKALRFMQNAVECGVSIDELQRIAKQAGTWTAWQHALDELIEDASQ